MTLDGVLSMTILVDDAREILRTWDRGCQNPQAPSRLLGCMSTSVSDTVGLSQAHDSGV